MVQRSVLFVVSEILIYMEMLCYGIDHTVPVLVSFFIKGPQYRTLRP